VLRGVPRGTRGRRSSLPLAQRIWPESSCLIRDAFTHPRVRRSPGNAALALVLTPHEPACPSVAVPMPRARTLCAYAMRTNDAHNPCVGLMRVRVRHRSANPVPRGTCSRRIPTRSQVRAPTCE